VLRQVLCRLEIWRVAFLKTTIGLGAHEKRFKKYCNETREKGASRASVAAARRNGVNDAIFGHGGTRTERSDTTDTALF
jgi:hypothetical protein